MESEKTAPTWSEDGARVLELHREICRLDAEGASREARAPLTDEMRLRFPRVPSEEVLRLLEEAYREVDPAQLERAIARRKKRGGS